VADQPTPDKMIGALIGRLMESGEGAFNKLSEQLLANPLFLDAMRRTIEAKGHVDKTISGTMDLVNLPSKNDISKIMEDIETLAGKMAKQERVLAKVEQDLIVTKTLVEGLVAAKRRRRKTA
jgi:predicted DNA-binding ArsR family transcriptional regulator